MPNFDDLPPAPKPTKTKTKHHLDDLDDILNPKSPDLPSVSTPGHSR